MSAQRLSRLDTSSVPGHVGDLLPIDPHRPRHRDTWIYRSRGACCSTIDQCRIPSWHNGTLACFTRIRWTWNSLLSYPNCFNGSTVGQKFTTSTCQDTFRLLASCLHRTHLHKIHHLHNSRFQAWQIGENKTSCDRKSYLCVSPSWSLPHLFSWVSDPCRAPRLNWPS